MARFFDATWFLWWLFAAIVIGRWYWITFIQDRHGDGNGPEPWRELYRMALLERATDKIAVRIEEAEGAIRLALATQLFRPHDPKRLALQDAMNNLRTLRESADWEIGTPPSGGEPHRSTRRRRPPHSWRSSGN